MQKNRQPPFPHFVRVAGFSFARLAVCNRNIFSRSCFPLLTWRRVRDGPPLDLSANITERRKIFPTLPFFRRRNIGFFPLPPLRISPPRRSRNSRIRICATGSSGMTLSGKELSHCLLFSCRQPANASLQTHHELWDLPPHLFPKGKNIDSSHQILSPFNRERDVFYLVGKVLCRRI